MREQPEYLATPGSLHMTMGGATVWIQWLVEFGLELERKLEDLQSKHDDLVKCYADIVRQPTPAPPSCQATMTLAATGEKLTCTLHRMHSSQGHMTPNGGYWHTEAVAASNAGGDVWVETGSLNET